MTTFATHVEIWHEFATELASMPDVIEKLAALHVATPDGRCRACTTPGRGTPQAPWPCSMAKLAREAVRAGRGARS